MGTPYTPSATSANAGQGYAGPVMNDPGSQPFAVQDPNRFDAKYFGEPVLSNIMALWAAAVGDKAWRKTYTCLAGLAVGDPVHPSAADTVEKALADTAAHSLVTGFAAYKPTTTTVYVAQFYRKTGLSGLTVASPVYLTDAGGYSATPGTFATPVGVAVSTTEAILWADVRAFLDTWLLGAARDVALTRLAASVLGVKSVAFAANTPSAISGNTNDYAPGAGTVQRWAASAAYNVTGLVAGKSGELRWLWNVGSYTITLKHEDTSSTAANRFTSSNGGDVGLLPGRAVLATYDTTTSRWLLCVAPFDSAALVPAQITGNTNDYAPGTASVQQWSSDNAYNITGLVAGKSGETRTVWNTGGFTLTLTNEDAASAAENRFTTSTGGNLALATKQCALMTYDAAASRWRVTLLP